jgi:hypothetical protein
MVAFFIITFLARIPTDRYLVSFLPFLVIPASYFMFLIFTKNKVFGVFLTLIILIISFCLTVFQVEDPANYLLEAQKLTYFGNSAYLHEFTSGYGVDETVSYLKNLSKQNKIMVTIAENTGNPESAIIIYFNKSSNVQVVYMDSKIFGSALNSYDCLSANVPLYFVARDEQLAGLDKYLEKVRTIKNPYGSNTIGIYTLKKNCQGKTFELRPVVT